MRLSEDRIDAIAQKVAHRLVKKGHVASKRPLRQVSAWVEKAMLDLLKMEDAIDQEVAAYIEGLSNKPPQGSFAYQALFQKKKEEVAARRGFRL